MSDKDESLKNTGRCAYAAIAEMVAALQCDYDRLEELREAREGHDGTPQDWASTNPDEAEELAELEAEAGDCQSEDDARRGIEEDALSVEVRSGWVVANEGQMTPAEFCILLSTGGPAVRIVGELRRGEPSRPRMEVQDWGTPWTEYRGEWIPGTEPGDFGHSEVDSDVLQAYCSVFCFGEE